MNIQPKIFSQCVKYFKSVGKITPALLMRKFKLEGKAALHICELVEKRFPNLWRKGIEEFYKDKKV